MSKSLASLRTFVDQVFEEQAADRPECGPPRPKFDHVPLRHLPRVGAQRPLPPRALVDACRDRKTLDAI